MNITEKRNADYRALSILAIAMLAGILLFSVMGIAVHYITGSSLAGNKITNTFFVLALLLAAAAITAARSLYKKTVDTLKRSIETSKEKLEGFRAMTLTHMALCEIPALLSVICFMLFGNFLFFLVVLMALVEMISKFPFRKRVETVVNTSIF